MLNLIEMLDKKSRDGRRLAIFECRCGDVSEYVYGRVISSSRDLCHKCSVKKGRELRKTHGMRNRREYSIWQGIKRRCMSKTDKDYPRYGGDGVTLFSGWIDDFMAFFNHVGPCDDCSLSIDRIDNRKGYEPGNVRWATRSEQQRNKDCSVFVMDVGGNKYHISDVAKLLGITIGAAHLRLKRGKLYGYSRI